MQSGFSSVPKSSRLIASGRASHFFHFLHILFLCIQECFTIFSAKKVTKKLSAAPVATKQVQELLYRYRNCQGGIFR
ncbi:hypothetical protein [Pedobacter alpinus]|uniref:hypothetical protein n=1 Tax=Pedobacter alpinus TaxID=1590643 RepID=UPI00367253C4